MASEVASLAALRAENTVLQQQIGALRQQREAQRLATSVASLNTVFLQSVCDTLPYAIYWKDRDLVYQGCNQRFAADLGLATPALVVGKTDDALPWQPGEATRFAAIDRAMILSGQDAPSDEHVVYPDGSEEWFETFKAPLRDPQGDIIGVLGTYMNVTQRKRAEQTIQRQAGVLADISTPLLPIADGLIVMPLIGDIDAQRADQMIAVLLNGINEHRARVAIVDITGVKIVDTHVASMLVRAAQAVALLGAQVVLTGIRPEIAQSLVQLGAQLSSMITHSSLQRGIAYALASRRS
ncbi:MAG: PAS domain-containing protein [Chloroflexales bacterium]|nr:PAS domain-containing protein [Chloroflexales bacterium]